jgi:hypothetical protein
MVSSQPLIVFLALPMIPRGGLVVSADGFSSQQHQPDQIHVSLHVAS